MTYQCDRCSRTFDAEDADDRGYRCLKKCGGSLTPAAAVPPDAALGTVDAAALPYPVALVLGRLRGRLARPDYPPQVALPPVKDAVEAAVKLLAAVLLAQYRLGPAATRERDEGLIERLVRPSLGQWVHGVLRPVAEWVGPGPVTGLFLAFGRGKPTTTPLFDRLAAFVAFRNDAIGHGAERPDHVCRRDLAEWLPVVGDLLRGTGTALAGRPLLLVADTDRAQVWAGPDPAAATVPGSFARGLVGRFVLGPAADPLPLDPFVCYVPVPDRTNRLHFYDSLAEYKVRKKRATVLEYDGGMRHDLEEPVPGLEAAFTAELLEKAFGRHRGRMAVIEGRVANFGSLVEAHAEIVGRRFALDRVAWFLTENDRGLLVVEGEPGRGKTALVAHLLEHVYGDHAPRPARFFYRRTAGITDPDVCVKSLYHELLATHGVTEAAESAARQAPDEVFTKLVSLLATEIAPRLAPHRPQLIFLDALDEADWDAFRRVPEELPAGVYVIATTRPVARRAQLARRAHIHWFDLDSPDHLQDHFADGWAFVERELAVADLPADTRAELARVGGGNFLVLTLLCRHVRDRLAAADVRPFLARLASARGAEQLGFIYAEFWDRLADRCPPEFRQPLCDVAGLLLLAKAPLPGDMVWGVLGLGSATWDAALGLLGEYLTALREAEDGAEATFYRLYHESFADFLRAKLAPDRSRLLGRFADYCAGWADLPEGFGRTYALQFGPSHHLDAGRSDGAVRLLTEWRFLEAKAEAGFVPGLVTDFGVVRAALPPAHPWDRRLGLLHAALRREVNFLTRRPQCLFQQLWNLGWWYDHPDAAAHYDLSIRAGTALLPWEGAGEKLHPFLDRWRREKEVAEPGYVWLRALRPPPTALGTALQAVFRGHSGQVLSVSWSPDGRLLATGSGDFTTSVWDAGTGAEVARLSGHLDKVWSVSWSPDGRLLATGADDRTARVWDAATGAEIIRIIGHDGHVLSVSWSPDGRLLATGSGDGTARVWDATSGAEVARLAGHTSAVASVSWSPDGRLLATGSGDGTARVWDAATGIELARLDGHDGSVRGVSWAPGGRLVATGGKDGTARVWDATSGAEVARLAGHDRDVRHVSWSPDGRLLATGSGDRTARVWDATSGAEVARLAGHTSAVASVSWSPDGRLLATGGGDGTARLWDPAAETEVARPDGRWSDVSCLSYSPDGRLLATGSGDGTARVWDAATGIELARLDGHDDDVSSVSWSPDGRLLATASRDHTARVWNPATGVEVTRLAGPDREVSSASWSPDGRLLATSSGDDTVRVWDPVTGIELARIGEYDNSHTVLSWSPDGRLLATGGEVGTARVSDPRTGVEITRLAGIDHWVNSMTWSPDGRFLAIASVGGIVRIVNPLTGAEITRLAGLDREVSSVSWAPDGRLLATGTRDETVQIWNLADWAGDATRRACGEPDPLPVPSRNGSLAVVWLRDTIESVVAWGNGPELAWVSPPMYGESVYVSARDTGRDNKHVFVFNLEHRRSGGRPDIAWVSPPPENAGARAVTARFAGHASHHVFVFALEGRLPEPFVG